MGEKQWLSFWLPGLSHHWAVTSQNTTLVGGHYFLRSVFTIWAFFAPVSSSPCSVAPCSAGFWFLGLDLCWWQGQGASAGWICLCHSWAALKPDRGGCSWRLIRLYHRCMIPGILTWWFIGSFFSGNWITLVVCAALSLSGSDLLHLLC